MDRTVTVRLDAQLKRQLARACRELGRIRSDVVRDALRRHLVLLRFGCNRQRLLPLAERAGYLTEQDVFHGIS
jgi:hypothetical protein